MVKYDKYFLNIQQNYFYFLLINERYLQYAMRFETTIVHNKIFSLKNIMKNQYIVTKKIIGHSHGSV